MSPAARIAGEVAYARAVEALATELATYIAAGVHAPAANGQGAVTRLLERVAEQPLHDFVEEFHLTRREVDLAMEYALTGIGETVVLIRRAALLP